MYRNYIFNSLIKNDFSQLTHVFQPQLALSSKQVIGVEILTRWQYDDNTYISPLEFIKVAEEENLIWKIDLFAVESAFEFICKTNIKTSINLSIKTLENEMFEKKFSSILKRFQNIRRHFIAIEITETVKATNINLVQKHLNFLKNLDIQIFLDDFSIDFSNLFALSSYPISGIKIDKSILKLLDTPNGNKILSSFFIFLKKLDLDIIFEGVEKLNELHFLMQSEMKNLFVQGFYISKPLSQKELEDFVLTTQLVTSKLLSLK